MNRGEFLKTIGAGFGGAILSGNVSGYAMHSCKYSFALYPLHKTLGNATTDTTIGAGNRGTVYKNFVFGFLDERKITGVAEPVKFSNNRQE